VFWTKTGTRCKMKGARQIATNGQALIHPVHMAV